MKPLQDIIVLDLSKVFAGPYCTQYLGDLGATIIKVEPVEGDDTRGWQPQRTGQSSTFLALNRNKRSVAVDLKTPEGLEIVHALAARADVVVQGFKGGTAVKLGVDYETLRGLNEHLIYCELSGYGHDGPLGGKPGYDVMLQAFGGMVSTMGQPEGPLARASFSPVDLGTGMHAVCGILAALMERNKTGKGMHVELTLLDSALGWMVYLAQNYWMTGDVPGPLGSAHGSLVPYQAFTASDGELMIGAGNERQWQRLCVALGLDQYASDPRFSTNSARVANREQTVKLVQSAVATQTIAFWLDTLADSEIPCAPIHTLDQALAHPQVSARQLIVHTQHPVLGELEHIGLPVRFDGQPRAVPQAAPLLGQHTAETLRSIGLDDRQIDDLVSRGVVVTAEDEHS